MEAPQRLTVAGDPVAEEYEAAHAWGAAMVVFWKVVGRLSWVGHVGALSCCYQLRARWENGFGSGRVCL